MKTNITLKIESDLLREAKLLATRRQTSLSRLLADQLEVLVRQEYAYDAAQRRALARLHDGFELGWTPPESRDDLYER